MSSRIRASAALQLEEAMTAIQSMPFDVLGDLTLLDLVLVVQEFTTDDDETVAAVSSLLESGQVQLRRPASKSV